MRGNCWDKSLHNFEIECQAEVLSPLLEGWELVVVQDLGDKAGCSSPVVARYEAGSATLDPFQFVDVLL